MTLFDIIILYWRDFMIIIAKRLKFMFIIGLVFGIVLSITGLILLNVTDDGSTTFPATVIFIIASIFLFLGLIDFFRVPKRLILLDDSKNELLIDCRGKVSFPIETKVTADSKYFVIPIADIITVSGFNTPEGGNLGGAVGGALGYAVSVRSVNRLIITFKIGEDKFTAKVKNLNDAVMAEVKIMSFVENRMKKIDKYR
jgi:hypothetical protein